MSAQATQKPSDKKPSAKPGVTEVAAKKEKKEKVARVAYNGTAARDEKGKLKEIPADFNPKLQKPLGRGDFADEATFWEMRAAESRKRAEAYAKKAEECRKLGNVKEKAKAKKLLRMQEQMALLEAQLKEQGVDVAALIAQIKPQA